MGVRKESSTVSAKPLKSATLDGLYDEDFALWCDETARLLRAGRLSDIDVENLVEEMEAMAGNQRREVRSRLRVLLMHLLKWEKQPDKRGRSWVSTIITQRRELGLLFEQSPSLRRTLTESLGKAYAEAMKDAARETGLPASTFASERRYPADQILDDDFWPGPDQR